VPLDVVDLVTASATDPIAVVGRLMVRAGVRHVAVCDGSKVIGVVSMRDVLDALLA
jgi:CBS domain-containing protein